MEGSPYFFEFNLDFLKIRANTVRKICKDMNFITNYFALLFFQSVFDYPNTRCTVHVESGMTIYGLINAACTIVYSCNVKYMLDACKNNFLSENIFPYFICLQELFAIILTRECKD
jgi:hypothetical protein